VAATVLITASRWNYTGPQSPDVDAPDVHWTWGDVHEIMSEAASTVDDSSRVDDFLALLDHEGLGPSETITEPRLRALGASRGVMDELFALADAVRTQGDWSYVYDRLSSLEDTPEKTRALDIGRKLISWPDSIRPVSAVAHRIAYRTH